VTVSATAGGDLRSYRGERRPVIGISASFQQARWGNWDAQATLLPRRYADRVSEAGGIPVLLPPVTGITQVLQRLDGLVLSGGGDIDPVRYGAVAGSETGQPVAERDAAELALYHQARAVGLPVLGICRGLQVINVAAGGTLHQHLPDVVGHDGHSPAEGSYGTHEVRVAPASCLAAVLGPRSRDGVAVPTHHHQAIDRLGGGLTATAWAADGIVEAVEPEPGDGAFLLAVQWHPEAGQDLSLFRALTAAAAIAMAGA
jgi:putative glutamine amidotransferase